MKKLLAERIVARYAAGPRALCRARWPTPRRVDEILAAGAERLRPMAEATMAEVRQKMGLR